MPVHEPAAHLGFHSRDLQGVQVSGDAIIKSMDGEDSGGLGNAKAGNGARVLQRVEAVNPLPPPTPKVSAATVLLMTLCMASAAGLGALPFFFVRSLSPAYAAIATASACGVMLAASFDLIHEGEERGWGRG